MTNAVYPEALDGLLSGAIDLDTGVLKAAFVRGYTYDATDVTVADIVATGTLNGTSAALGSVTITSGVVDAADTSISTTASANDHALIIFQASAVTGGADVAQSSQRLVAYMDTGTGLPIQPGTGTVTVTFDAGTNRIFKIG